MSTQRRMMVTPIKRNQLITNSGAGAVIRTRNGVTALVCSLKDWDATVPVSKDSVGVDRDIERNRFYRKLELRDPELEVACNVARFISPYPVSENPSRYSDWLIPVLRFPLAGYCTNWQCQRITWSTPDDPSNARCTFCAVQEGKYSRKRSVQQMPMFKVCASGHIDEIEWSKEIELASSTICDHVNVKVQLGNSIKKPVAICVDCGGKSDPQAYERTCTGSRTWAIGLGPEACGEVMHVVERTSVQVYYSQIKSALHMPAPINFDESLLEWLISFDGFDFFDPSSDIAISGLFARVSGLNFKVTRRELVDHVTYLKSGQKDSAHVVWNEESSRSRELDVLTSPFDANGKYGVRLLEHKVLDVSVLDEKYFGENGLFSGVTAIHKLTETRVQDGFSRFRPPIHLSSLAGQQRLWGLDKAVGNWLPGYRVYGEGILFTLNSDRVSKWVAKSPTELSNDEIKFKLAHSLAHLIVSASALECGYQVAGIRDRIYSLEDGRLALMVYTADGDSVGTLGGLVELSTPEKIASLIDRALSDGAWCAQDPVCIGSQTFQVEHQSGACHQCILLPETSCEKFNRSLDRAFVFGNTERKIPGYLD